MVEIKLESDGERHIVQLYTTATELPIHRYSVFQKYNLLESGIGSDMESIGGHFSKLFEFIGLSMREDAIKEATNMYYSFYNLLKEINIPGMAFVCLVHAIDGKVVTDLTEEAIKKKVVELDRIGLTQADCLDWVDNVKKKSFTN